MAKFKREVVALLEGSGRPRTQVAMELGIRPSMLRAWREIARGGRGRPPILASQNAKLKRALDQTRMKRDVPKKAIGLFAEGPR